MSPCGVRWAHSCRPWPQLASSINACRPHKTNANARPAHWWSSHDDIDISDAMWLSYNKLFYLAVPIRPPSPTEKFTSQVTCPKVNRRKGDGDKPPGSSSAGHIKPEARLAEGSRRCDRTHATWGPPPQLRACGRHGLAHRLGRYGFHPGKYYLIACRIPPRPNGPTSLDKSGATSLDIF